MPASLEATIAANLQSVRDRIARAVAASGRASGSVRLIAVSKTFGLDQVRAAAAAGQQDLGENKVQEALQKIASTTELRLRWHLIGHLQSNKARRAAGSFAWIHSVDSAELLERLDAAAAEQGTSPELLVQVDLGREPTKHGAPVESVRGIFERAAGCRAARVRGLMLLPPWSEDPEPTRKYFRDLRRLRDELLAEGFDPSLLGELSMGMSHDYEVAIEEGATMVRIGTAIFGKRQLP